MPWQEDDRPTSDDMLRPGSGIPDFGADWAGNLFSGQIGSLHGEIKVSEGQINTLKQCIADIAITMARVNTGKTTHRSFGGMLSGDNLTDEAEALGDAIPLEKISLFLAINRGIAHEHFQKELKATKLLAEAFGRLAATDNKIDEYVSFFGYDESRALLFRSAQVNTVISGHKSRRDATSIAEGFTGELEAQEGVEPSAKENLAKTLDAIWDSVNKDATHSGKEATIVAVLAEGKESDDPERVRKLVRKLEGKGVYVVMFYPNGNIDSMNRMNGYVSSTLRKPIFAKAFGYSEPSDIVDIMGKELKRVQTGLRRVQNGRDFIGSSDRR